MSVFRSTLSTARALSARPTFCAPSRAAGAGSIRAYSTPTKVVRKDEKGDPLEEHRVEVEPKLAAIDETITFEHPKKWGKHPGHDMTKGDFGRHTKRTLASFSMDGKVCLVTGAARGLGNMMARTFVESGANAIVLVDLKKEDAERAAEDLVKWFVENGEAEEGEIQALGLGCDVSDEASVASVFATVKEKFGRLDAVVTAAGIVENYVAHEYPTQKIKKLLDINIMGTWYCALEAAKLMPEGGSITLVGSMSGSIVNVPQPQTPYNFSKAGVRHMARSLAVEWATKGIRVNCLAPGYTLTNLTKVILDANPVLRDEWLHRIPMGRLADPSDLKGAVIYLASDSSKYTTGAEIVVDGGYTCL
ncbi:d-arabinitol 2-dehydrogenase [Kwoniella heveanensis CBS 569]|uniref:D-arabinitol 2-dehydrogenase n=1 Tax=Kwoniella heveanensis BCC8398 TaxID=1296120 RepID=A0A1B9GQK4_9TREE|nr:d-arabinitol 2-dehydrogenase [Kwoniella heveanensis BCC8398]OCF41409.1 d-arabinitol 2-dehydrogenase [Kwoniella heveanensis CBS 569]